MSLLEFFFNTLRKRANYPANKRFWLPGVLADVDGPSPPGGKLLPPKDLSWDVGKIENLAGNTIVHAIVGAARTLLAPKLVNYDPDNPYPSLAISKATITGLNNVTVQPNPKVTSRADGYEAVIGLLLNAYSPTSPGGEGLQSLAVEGTYTMKITLSVKDTATSPAKPYPITGVGTFRTDLTNTAVNITIDLEVSGTGSARTCTATVVSLDLVGADQKGGPVLTSTVLSIHDTDPSLAKIWEQGASEALNNPETTPVLLQNIKNTINDPQVLRTINDALTGHLGNVLDGMFGKVPEGGLPDDAGQVVPNPADLYLFDRLRVAVSDKSGGFYLPAQLISASSPTLEPLALDDIDLGAHDVYGITFQPNTLSSIQVVGLSNNIAPPPQLVWNGPLLNVKTTQGALVSEAEREVEGKTVPAPPLSLRGRFSFQMTGSEHPVITGSFTITVAKSNLSLGVTAGGTDLSSLTVTVQSISFQADASNLTITLQCDDSSLQDFANALVGQDGVKTTLIKLMSAAIDAKKGIIGPALAQFIQAYGLKELGPIPPQ